MYDRQVKDQEVTLTVSGKLWNRSLVMQDTETKSLWSHILGEAMDGELKGVVLKSLPSDMVTWNKWKAAHPTTTVLNLKRSSRNYTKEFYKDPSQFVIGFRGDRRFHHCSFATLVAKPVLNIKTDGVQLVLTDTLHRSV